MVGIIDRSCWPIGVVYRYDVKIIKAELPSDTLCIVGNSGGFVSFWSACGRDMFEFKWIKQIKNNHYCAYESEEQY